MKTRPLSQVILPEEVFEVQSAQYRDIILLTGIVPALSGGQDFSINVSSEGHFFLQSFTGTFEALTTPVAAITDSGVTYLSGQLKDGSRNLFSDRVPLDLILSPGRRRSATSTTIFTGPDPVGNSLFVPMEFEYLYKVNSNIIMNISNTSNTPNRFEIAFHGWRIVSSSAAEACREKARQMRRQ